MTKMLIKYEANNTYVTESVKSHMFMLVAIIKARGLIKCLCTGTLKENQPHNTFMTSSQNWRGTIKCLPGGLKHFH